MPKPGPKKKVNFKHAPFHELQSAIKIIEIGGEMVELGVDRWRGGRRWVHVSTTGGPAKKKMDPGSEQSVSALLGSHERQGCIPRATPTDGRSHGIVCYGWIIISRRRMSFAVGKGGRGASDFCPRPLLPMLMFFCGQNMQVHPSAPQQQPWPKLHMHWVQLWSLVSSGFDSPLAASFVVLSEK